MLKIAIQRIAIWFNWLPRCLRWVVYSVLSHCISKVLLLFDTCARICPDLLPLRERKRGMGDPGSRALHYTQSAAVHGGFYGALLKKS